MCAGMQIAMVGLGRMGANLVRRLMRGGHDCVVFDRDPATVARLTAEGATGAASLAELAGALVPPRAVWVMVPADAVDGVLDELAPHLGPGDVVVDGGNSHHLDDVARAERLASRGIRFLDVGTSGGVHGLERGYCLMVGGDPDAVARLAPVFATLAPGAAAAPRTPGRSGPPAPEEVGWLHCGPVGAGHFVKMVHNGIEYGMMAAYAEGLAILDAASRAGDGPHRFPLDVAAIAELWRRGSVISSWLLDLTAAALAASPGLAELEGVVADSGEGRWTVQAAVDLGVPAHALSAALYARFASQGRAAFANRVQAAMRRQFGGHGEPAPNGGVEGP
jgi:6-phosphogluconate dehydrogenase